MQWSTPDAATQASSQAKPAIRRMSLRMPSAACGLPHVRSSITRAIVEIAKVTPADVQRVAGKYFVKKNRTAAYTTPAGAGGPR